MIIDTHAHYISPSAIAEAEKNPEQYGIRVEWNENGEPRLAFGQGPLIRPLRPRLLELEERRQIMARQRVDLQIVYTWLDAVGYSLPPEQGQAWCRVQNETMAADLEGKDYLAGLATVPLQSGGLAAEELSYAVKTLDMKGAGIASNVDGKNLDDPEFAPFWQMAEELGVPVVIHPYNVAGKDRMQSYFLNNLVGNPLDTTIAAASLVFGGIADRHPHLRVVLVHGGGCLPYLIGRLQWGYERYPQHMGNGLKKTPNHYLSWFYYDHLLYNTANIKHMIELVSPERTLLGTDYPFPIEDPEPVNTIEKLRLAANFQEMILESNPKALFRL
jgi:aminocarboxymuconate-semialdehyde decarboxylase